MNQVETDINILQDVIRAIRKIRADYNISADKKITVTVVPTGRR